MCKYGVSTTQTTQAHTRIYTTRELVWELNRSCLETCVQQERKGNGWMGVNRTEGQDQGRMERTLIQLNAGHPNGTKDRRRTRAKAKTDSRGGLAPAYQNRAARRSAIFRSGRQGLLATDGVHHHRHSRLSQVVDGAPHQRHSKLKSIARSPRHYYMLHFGD